MTSHLQVKDTGSVSITSPRPRPSAEQRGAAYRLPDFIIIGAMKCGTTSLHHILNAHPDIFIPPGEVRFFALDDYDVLADKHFDRETGPQWLDLDSHWEDYLAWYVRHFQDHRDGQLVGEDAPAYLASARAAARIAKTLPGVRILILLRDPVERAYSHYWHNVVKGRCYFSFEDTLVRCPGSILDRGKYKAQLEVYLNLFPRERIKILLFEEFTADPHAVSREVLNFLQVDAARLPDAIAPHHNRTPLPRSVRAQLWLNYALNTTRGRPFAYPLPRIYSSQEPAWRSRLAKLCDRLNLRRGKRPPPMNDRDRVWLQQYYARENAGLDRILERDLSVVWPNWRA